MPTNGQLGGKSGPGFILRLAGLLCALTFLCGCGLIFEGNYQDAKQEESLDKEALPENPLPYKVKFVVQMLDGSEAVGEDFGFSGDEKDGTAGESGGNEDEAAAAAYEEQTEAQAEENAEADENMASHILKLMKAQSQLVRLKKEPPDGELGLELRTRRDVETALKIMASDGYFEGTADMLVEDTDKDRANVTITLKPGVRYVVGQIEVNYLPDLLLPERLENRSEDIFPRTGIPGVKAGEPITAAELLDKVNAIPGPMRRNAYPDAKIKEAYFYLDREKRTVNAIIDVEPGEPATIGIPIFSGNTTVKAEYLMKFIEWEPGVTLWDQEEIEDYVSRLRATGLFRKVAAAKAAGRVEGSDPTRQDVELSLEESEHRTIGAQAEYSTDSGFGVAGQWEHRNILGSGEKLTVKAPYSTTERGVKADFTKPFFYSKENTLHIWGSSLYETTDAYEREGVQVNAAIKRRWSKYFSTETGPFGDVGYLKNNAHGLQEYTVYGLNLTGKLDTRDDDMNPTTGTVTELNLKPMTGQYNENFNALGAEFHISGYWAPFTKEDGTKDDALVLAARVGLGGITGVSLNNLPSTYRYYMGGVSTVRGYGYQQIGPMDSSGDPLGGRSYQNISLESRFKVTDDLGFVLFVDGGQLYSDELPQFDTDMDWGAGAGIRYFTPIGPLRFDVGVPLKDVDPPLQVYISIGQAF